VTVPPTDGATSGIRTNADPYANAYRQLRSAREPAAAAPSVRITIGRIEVVALPAPQPAVVPPRPQAPERQDTALADFLAKSPRAGR
jgi:hypothetical protein